MDLSFKFFTINYCLSKRDCKVNLWITLNHRIVRNLILKKKMESILQWKTQKLVHVLKKSCHPLQMRNHVYEIH